MPRILLVAFDCRVEILHAHDDVIETFECHDSPPGAVARIVRLSILTSITFDKTFTWRPATLARRPRTFEEVRCTRSAGLITLEGVRRGLAFRPRPSDVIITPYGKCGTTWLQQIFHGLRTRGDMDFDDISRVVPWIETAHDLGLDLDAPQRGQPRGYKSHLSYDLVPKGARYIVSIRDPERRAGIGVPFHARAGSSSRQRPDRTICAERISCSRGARRDYWHHLLSWWAQRNNPNVLMLCYEQMNRDFAATVRPIARVRRHRTRRRAVRHRHAAVVARIHAGAQRPLRRPPDARAQRTCGRAAAGQRFCEGPQRQGRRTPRRTPAG